MSVQDVAAALAWADLVICRAGALTVAEIACAGVASVLIPYPYAVDDHQTGNARFLSDQGAAVLLPQSDLTPAGLTRQLSEFRRETLANMAEKARARAFPDATRQLATACAELAP